MDKEELYPTDEELIRAELTVGWKETPHYRDEEWGDYYHDAKRAIAKYAVDNAVKKIVDHIEKNMEPERCDPDVMAYFTDFYWIPKDVWQDKIKELIK